MGALVQRLSFNLRIRFKDWGEGRVAVFGPMMSHRRGAAAAILATMISTRSNFSHGLKTTGRISQADRVEHTFPRAQFLAVEKNPVCEFVIAGTGDPRPH